MAKQPNQPSVTKVEEVRNATGMSPRDLPVDLQKITEHLGLKVYYANFSDSRISGMLITDASRVPQGTVPGKNATIFLKSGEYPPRARFTLAHEIGHYCLGHHNDGVVTDFYRGHSDGYSDPNEKDANEFAAELLMPKIMFTQLWQSKLVLEELSVIFSVSIEALLVRARALNLGEPTY